MKATEVSDNRNLRRFESTNSDPSKDVPRRLALAFVFVFFWCHVLNAQTFTRVTTGHIVNDGARSAGAAWGDYNNDGFQDLFVTNQEFLELPGDNFLYQNNGDGTFTRITEGDLVNDGGESVGPIWGDYDDDGNLDIFVLNAPGVDVLYRNEGNGTFAKSEKSLIVQNSGDKTWAACWADIDNDGDLDVFVATGSDVQNRMYANNGDGTYVEITSGVFDDDVFTGHSNGANWVDYDNDGHMDLFILNIGSSNFLYRSIVEGNFTKITTGDIVSGTHNSQGSSWGDYDNDGDLDVYITNGGLQGAQPNLLYSNNGDGSFTRITEGEIVELATPTVSSSWGDYDNDGDVDLFLANDQLNFNFMYSNNGDGTFTKAFIESGVPSFACASADYDNDGDLDIFVANWRSGSGGTDNVLLQNEGNDNNWVNINCISRSTQLPVFGAKVRIKATINAQPIWQMREIASQTGRASQNSFRVHFGLGDATAIDSLKLEWPSDIVDTYTNVTANNFYEAVEGAGLNPFMKP
jgi:hypothetical protein